MARATFAAKSGGSAAETLTRRDARYPPARLSLERGVGRKIDI